MVNWGRVRTVIRHSWYHLGHSMETWVDLYWFTGVSMAIFGLLTLFLEQSFGSAVKIILIGNMFWEFVRIAQYALTMSMMWEVWSKSFTTMFISPLSFRELILGKSVVALAQAVGVFIFISAMSAAFFGIHMWELGWVIGWYMLILFIFGMAIGMLVMSLIIRFGTQIQSLAWSSIYLFQPISAIMYPIEVLPPQIRWLAYMSPISYVMESIRTQLAGGTVSAGWLGLGSLLSLVYLVGSAKLLAVFIRQSKQSGAFARMEQ
jgi:ABC-2 type transport system permease protein